jgi:hypothetical protein
VVGGVSEDGGIVAAGASGALGLRGSRLPSAGSVPSTHATSAPMARVTTTTMAGFEHTIATRSSSEPAICDPDVPLIRTAGLALHIDGIIESNR